MCVSSKYERAAMSEIYRLRRQGFDLSEVVVDRLESRKYGEQRRLGDGFNDEAPTLSSQNGLATGQLHVARNAECLIPTVPEKTHVPFGVHGPSLPVAYAVHMLLGRLGEDNPGVQQPLRTYLVWWPCRSPAARSLHIREATTRAATRSGSSERHSLNG